MASKENQMSLDIIAKALPFETYICYIHTLQQAIDDLELKDKALDKACEELANRGRNCVSCNFEDCSDFELDPICENKNFWKEYLLKESEKE